MTLKERARRRLLSHGGRAVIGLWMRLCRWSVRGEEAYSALRRTGRPVILLVWHGKIFTVPFFFRKRNIMPLVSPSRDGEFVARLMDGWGYKVIRGSGSHPMKTAWIEIKRELAAGGEVIIVPDGPKGPDRKFKLGGIKLAAETGAALVPWSFRAKRRKNLRSWDRFEMFYPLTRVAAVFGTPFEVPRDLPAEALEEHRRRAEEIMVAFDAEVDRLFETGG